MLGKYSPHATLANGLATRVVNLLYIRISEGGVQTLNSRGLGLTLCHECPSSRIYPGIRNFYNIFLVFADERIAVLT